MVNPLLLMMLSATPVLQDPTLPLGSVPEPPSSSAMTEVAQQQLRLQAVLRGGQVASAIIDGRHYHLGDRVGGYRLAEIGRSQVRLEGQGESLELRLFSPLTLRDVQ